MYRSEIELIGTSKNDGNNDATHENVKYTIVIIISNTPINVITNLYIKELLNNKKKSSTSVINAWKLAISPRACSVLKYLKFAVE